MSLPTRYGHLDGLRPEQLPRTAREVADALSEWLLNVHGMSTSPHHVGAFLDLLAERGYEVTRTPHEAMLDGISAWCLPVEDHDAIARVRRLARRWGGRG